MKLSQKQNMGMFDRMLRICLGMMLLMLGTLIIGGTVGVVLVIAGAVLLITALTGFCPTYTLLGVSTKQPMGCR